MVQWLGLDAFTAKSPDSIPGWRIKITGHVAWLKKKKMSEFVPEMREQKFRAGSASPLDRWEQIAKGQDGTSRCQDYSGARAAPGPTACQMSGLDQAQQVCQGLLSTGTLFVSLIQIHALRPSPPLADL